MTWTTSSLISFWRSRASLCSVKSKTCAIESTSITITLMTLLSSGVFLWPVMRLAGRSSQAPPSASQRTDASNTETVPACGFPASPDFAALVPPPSFGLRN